jgi:hypothetical protein
MDKKIKRHFLQRFFECLAILVLLMSTTGTTHAQRGFDITSNNRIIINYTDRIVYAEVRNRKLNQKPKDKYFYYWYNANDIKKTKGGFDGKLLHGKYTEFYSNKNLKTQGTFRNGIKHGTWKSWHTNGQFSEVVKWKKKGTVGEFNAFDENGDLIRTGTYKNDRLDGLVREKVDEKFIKKRYKDGVQVKGLVTDTIPDVERKNMFSRNKKPKVQKAGEEKVMGEIPRQGEAKVKKQKNKKQPEPAQSENVPVEKRKKKRKTSSGTPQEAQ